MLATAPTMVRVRATTRRKIDVIAKAKTWPLVTVLEKAADALLEKEGISVGQTPAGQRTKRPKRSAA